MAGDIIKGIFMLLFLAPFLAFGWWVMTNKDGITRKVNGFMNRYGIAQSQTWADASGVGSRRGFAKNQINWAEIHAIWAIRNDSIPLDVIFLMLDSNDGRQVVVGQFDRGFDDVIRMSRTKLEGFPQDWLDLLGPYVDQPKLIWSRIQAAA